MNTETTETTATPVVVTIPELLNARPHAQELGADTLSPGTLVAVEDTTEAGVLVWWRFSGDVYRDELSETWKANGGEVDDLPTATSAQTALRYAARAAARTVPHVLARPIRGTGRFAAGWALVSERAPETPAEEAPATPAAATDATEDTAVEGPAVSEEVLTGDDPLAYRVLAVVHLSQVGGSVGVVVSGRDPAVTASFKDTLVERFAYFRDNFTARDLANWLPRRIVALDGIAVRDNGGVYFIPRDSRVAWERLVNTLRAVSAHKVFGVPVLPVEDTAYALLDAVEREVKEWTAATILELPDLKDRGRAARLAQMAKLKAKLTKYEGLFGAGRLDAVRASLSDLDLAKDIADLTETPAEG